MIARLIKSRRDSIYWCRYMYMSTRVCVYMYVCRILFLDRLQQKSGLTQFNNGQRILQKKDVHRRVILASRSFARSHSLCTLAYNVTGVLPKSYSAESLCESLVYPYAILSRPE